MATSLTTTAAARAAVTILYGLCAPRLQQQWLQELLLLSSMGSRSHSHVTSSSSGCCYLHWALLSTTSTRGWERREERLGKYVRRHPPVERYVDAKSLTMYMRMSIDVRVAFVRLLGARRDCAPMSFVQHRAHHLMCAPLLHGYRESLEQSQ
jgi:hypothetical protein